jgi:GNAT superfamily N-acetyltransferase
MIPGIRQHKSASLRIALPAGLPEDMREGISEIISVHSGNQRKGHASALLSNVCKEADKLHQVLFLRVEAYDDGIGNEQLLKWYGTHGFKIVQNYPVVLMARDPK